MKHRKTEKARNELFSALTYLRLQGDLRAIETEIEGARPLAKKEDENVLLKTLNSISVEFQNELRRSAMHDLTAEKRRAMDALLRYERTAEKSAIALAKKPDALRKLGDKRLWQNDPFGIVKMQYAIAFAGNGDGYLRPDESLTEVSKLLFGDEKAIVTLCTSYRKNFAALQKGGFEEIYASVFSTDLFLFPVFRRSYGVIATVFGSPMKERQMRAAMDALSKDELRALLAMKLTVVENALPQIDEKEKKELIDETLKYIDNLRADAEYEWLVEGIDIPTCKEKITLATLAVSRLSLLLEL